MIDEKILDQVMYAKSARFVKRDGGRAVPGARLQHLILPTVRLDEELYQRFPVPLPLKIRRYGDIFQLQDSIALIRHNALSLDAIVLQHVHDPALQIAVDHVLLLIRQQEKREVLLFVGFDVSDFHSKSLNMMCIFCLERQNLFYHVIYAGIVKGCFQLCMLRNDLQFSSYCGY